MKIDSIKIRMYRHGFGDCFLLRFFSGETLKYKMLIDCGLKTKDSVPGVSIQDVVKDIIKECSVKKGRKSVPHLDVLVITHEHWDHVSAFSPSLALFDQFDIDNIWLAWTENPDDDEAKIINANLRNNVVALTHAINRINDATKKAETAGYYQNIYRGSQILGARKEFTKVLGDVVSFYNPILPAKSTNTPKVSPSGIKYDYKVSIGTQEALNHVKHKLAPEKSGIKYFYPGDMLDGISELLGIRIYVLGPPKNEKMNKDTPSKDAKKETYLGRSNPTMFGFVKGILLNLAGEDDSPADGSPFSNDERVVVSTPKRDKYLSRTYFKGTEAWRTIEDDWLNIAGSLALQIDRDTNNTSLVLAIELVESKKVLLFPGDAQVGNWLSWHDLSWDTTYNGKHEKINARTLLNNTVFYKVGHHASHNATLKDLGLELMNHDELVCFIPEKNDQYNGIPHHELLTRMKEKAKGRVLFSADKNYPPEDTLKRKPAGLSSREWLDFKNKVKIQNHFIEYTIH